VEHNLRSNAEFIRTQVFRQKHSNDEWDLRMSSSFNFAATWWHPETWRVLLLFEWQASIDARTGVAGICKQQIPHEKAAGSE